MLDFISDIKGKPIKLELTIEGERTPLEVSVSYCELEEDSEKYYLVAHNVSTSKMCIGLVNITIPKWINNEC